MHVGGMDLGSGDDEEAINPDVDNRDEQSRSSSRMRPPPEAPEVGDDIILEGDVLEDQGASGDEDKVPTPKEKAQEAETNLPARVSETRANAQGAIARRHSEIKIKAEEARTADEGGDSKRTDWATSWFRWGLLRPIS